MVRKRHTAEQVVNLLRQIEVAIANGNTTVLACKEALTTVRAHSSLGYRSPAPEAWLINSTGHGEVETATRFPLLHTPDGGYLNLIGPGNFVPVEMLVFGKL